MVSIIVALCGVLAILVLSEVLWRLRLIRGEYARKFVHIATGSFVAFWPWFLSWRAIQGIALAFLAVVIVARGLNRYSARRLAKGVPVSKRNLVDKVLALYCQLNIFNATFDVRRRTNGEELFAIGILLASLFTVEPWMFALAVLTMTLSDGLAAVLGTAFGKGARFRVFGSVKSLVGSLTFFVVTFFLMIGLSTDGGHAVSRSTMVMAAAPLALMLTCLEVLSAKGTDNITIPLATILALRFLVS